MEKKKIRPLLFFLILAVAEFIIYYTIYLNAKSYDTVYYYVYFIERFIAFGVPCAAGAVLAREGRAKGATLLGALYISLTRAIFTLPFFYLEYVVGPFDSVEAILLSLLTTVIICGVTFLFMWLASFLISYISKKRGDMKVRGEIAYFDMKKPFTFGVFIVSLIPFGLSLVAEVYSSVSFFIESGGIFFMGEIALLVCSYLFLPALLLGIHAVSCLLAKKLARDEAS